MKSITLNKKELRILRVLLDSQVLSLEEKHDKNYLEEFCIDTLEQAENLYKKLKQVTS